MEVHDYVDIFMRGDRDGAQEAVKREIAAGMEPKRVIDDRLIAAMNQIGDRFRRGEVFVPEVMIAARAMQAGVTALKPFLKNEECTGAGRVLIGTVEGDLHDIGKNLVITMLEASGFQVTDLGIDVPVVRFVDEVRIHQPDIVAMSALLTTTMVNMQSVISALEGAGLRDKVKVMVGGAPVTPEFARRIGADAYGADAAHAVEQARVLLA